MKKTQDPKASNEKIFDYSHSSKGPPENSTPSEGEQQIQLDRDTQAAGNRVSRRIPESSSNVPKDAIAIDIPPEASRITRGAFYPASHRLLLLNLSSLVARWAQGAIERQIEILEVLHGRNLAAFLSGQYSHSHSIKHTISLMYIYRPSLHHQDHFQPYPLHLVSWSLGNS